MVNPSYNSSSLLSLYLTETSTLNEQPIPEIHISGDVTDSDSAPGGLGQSNSQSNPTGSTTPSEFPRRTDSLMQSPTHTFGCTDQKASSPSKGKSASPSRVSCPSPDPNGSEGASSCPEAQLMGATLGREISATSHGHSSARTSIVSSVNSLYSSINTFSDEEDLDFQSIQCKLDGVEIDPKKSNSKHILRNLLRRKEETKAPLSKDEEFFVQVQERLIKQNFHYDKKSTLKVNWLESCEVFFFGSRLDDLFTPESCLSYLQQSSYELGETRFSNFNRYHEVKNTQPVEQLLRGLLPNLESFNKVLDLYAESDKNVNSPELFEVFSNYANNLSSGLCIPLAISMFGNWLLTYNKDKTLSSNFENPVILDYFRKSARLSLVILKCKPVLESGASTFNKTELAQLSKYWGKDNRNSLGISLHGLGEYYQYINEYDTATTLWEMNCHLTDDNESGNLAVLGLTDGFGYGNRIKHRNRLGKKSKADRYNTKRRIAQVYRILMKKSTFDEYGVSWVTKTKYD